MSEQKEKKNDFSIKSTFQNWLSLQGIQNVVYICGPTGAGKSTLINLIIKHIDNDPDPNLKLVEKKKDNFEYECEGQINPKSTKPLTIYPKKYEIKSQQIKIIEVPSRIYSLEKKRPCLDKILNVIGLAYASKKACFLFTVDAKNTSGKCEPWKKAFQFIFDCFNLEFLNEKTFQSIGFIVSKGANDYEKNVYLSRIQDFYKLFDEEKRKNAYIQFLKTVQNQRNLSVFTKTTANEQITKRDVKQIFGLIQKLSKNSISLQKQTSDDHSIIQIEPVQLDKQEENCFIQFNKNLITILQFFSKFFEKLFTSTECIDILTFSAKSSQNSSENQKIHDSSTPKQHFLKQNWPVDANGQLKENSVVREKFNQLKKKSKKNYCLYQNSIGKASLILAYTQRIEKNSNKKHQILKVFLQILAQHGLIETDNKQLPQLESLYIELIQFSIFEERFGGIIKNIDYKEVFRQKQVTRQFRDVHHQFVQSEIHLDFINRKFSFNYTSQQAKKYSQIIEKFFSQKQIKDEYQKSIPLLKKNLLLLSFDRNDPKKGIIEIDKLLDKLINEDKILESVQKNQSNPSVQLKNQIQFLNSLALQVARMLKEYGLPVLCSQIFKDCGDYHSAKECYKIKLRRKKNQEQTTNLQEIKELLNNYLDLLQEMSLFQKALQECYQFAQIYRQIRPEINSKIKQIKLNRLKSFDEGKQKEFEEKFLNNSSKLSSLYTDKDLLSKIKEIAQGIKK